MPSRAETAETRNPTCSVVSVTIVSPLLQHIVWDPKEELEI